MDIVKETVIDILEPTGPALSSTSDMPVIETKPDATAVPSKEEPAKAETPKEEAEQLEESATSTTDEQTGQQTSTPRGVGKRLAELTKQREEAEKQRDEERAEKFRLLALLETRGEKPKADQAQATEDDPAPVKPAKQDFPDPDTWDLALEAFYEQKAVYTAKREIKTAQAEAARKAQADAVEAEQRAARESYNGRKEKVMERYPDFNEVAESPDVQVSIPMAHAIINSPDGPDIQYYLGKNPPEAKRISALSPPLQLMELGLIAAQIKGLIPKVPISAAAKPIKPITPGTEPARKSAEEEPMEEYARRRNKELAAAQRH